MPVITEEPIFDKNLNLTIKDISALSHHPDLNDSDNVKNPDGLKDSKENNNTQGAQVTQSLTDNKTIKYSKISLSPKEGIYELDLDNSPFSQLTGFKWRCFSEIL